MNNRMIKTAAAVPSLRIADPVYNTEIITRMMLEHKDCGIIVFPELCMTGYTCADLFQQKWLLDEAQNCLVKIAEASAQCPGMTAAVGCPLPYGNDLYNTAVIISEGKICGVIPKQYIPVYGEFYEGRWFASGKMIRNQTIRINGGDVPFGTDLLFKDDKSGAVLGAEICEDLWVPDPPSVHASLAGANIIINLSASDEIIGKQEYRRDIVLRQSSSCYCGYIYVSAGTDESSTDLVFSGHSLIADNGRLVKEVIFPEENHVETGLIDLDMSFYNRTHAGTFETDLSPYRMISTSIRPLQGYQISAKELAAALKEEHYRVAAYPFVPSDESDRAERCRKILQIQANGLATRVRHTGIKTLIIGISGGLDSTLALIVCHEAQKLIRDIRIIGYTMPNEGNTTSLTYNNAIDLMKALGAEIREVPIGRGVAEHLEAIGHGGVYKGECDTTYENAQARMRTYILMDAANMENGLVVGTGDLSELALGWCTYNGDHMSMYGVNGSVPKTLVRYICQSYAYDCGDDELKRVLLSIADTPISPELTPNKDGEIAQKTEDKIGKYDLNDFFLYYVLRYGTQPAKIIALAMRAYPGLEEEEIKEALRRFAKRFFYQQFKRSCLPDGPKVGSVTLSPRGDWRMPSDASPALFLQKIDEA